MIAQKHTAQQAQERREERSTSVTDPGPFEIENGHGASTSRVGALVSKTNKGVLTHGIFVARDSGILLQLEHLVVDNTLVRKSSALFLWRS